MSDLSIHQLVYWHDQLPEAPQEGITILTMWFPFVDDLGYTLSVTTQNTRYVDRRYWPDQVNQSSEDWVHTFSSTTLGLGVESTPDNCVRLYIFSFDDQTRVNASLVLFLTQGVVKLQPVVLVHFVCIEHDKWGIYPSLIVEEKNI